MLINHIAILLFILSQCFNLGLLSFVPKEHVHDNQEKPEKTLYYTISKEKLMWKDASIACKKKGLNLASVHSFKEYKKFTDFLHKYEKTNSVRLSELWVGGRRTKTNPSYYWENGKLVEIYGWLNQFSNYPGQCIEVRYIYNFGWENAECEKLNKYICAGEVHEEVLKKDFPEQYQRPNVETHEGGQNINEMEVRTEAPTTTTIFPEEDIYLPLRLSPYRASSQSMDMYDYYYDLETPPF